jgi:UDP-N-acetylmuramate--alanine ligase
MKIPYKHVHLIGIGGIHVGAVAKLLSANGVMISGSDAVDHDLVRELRDAGFKIAIGHHADNIPDLAEAVVFSHAVREDNPELIEAKHRGIPTIDTHAFLGMMFEEAKQIVVTGTHGKSTTTSMLGVALSAIGESPTVVVGTKVPSFADGNVRVGREDLLVVEGDEYRCHLLSYQPTILIVTNIEYDHPDAFPTVDSYIGLFRDALEHVRDNGAIIYSTDDRESVKLIQEARQRLGIRGIRVIGLGSKGQVTISEPTSDRDGWTTELRIGASEALQLHLMIPGAMNARNAVMALLASSVLCTEERLDDLVESLATFPGCWRRFERVGTLNGAIIISDYGHHPTEISETLKAAKLAYPDRRVILCFQPHHRNRTRGLFNDFIPSFDLADVLLLEEIYDVPGRELPEDAGISSSQLVTAVKERDAGFGRDRHVEFIPDLETAEKAIRDIATPQDLIIVMGAGTIDGVARRVVG